MPVLVTHYTARHEKAEELNTSDYFKYNINVFWVLYFVVIHVRNSTAINTFLFSYYGTYFFFAVHE